MVESPPGSGTGGAVKWSRSTVLLQEIDRLIEEIDAVLEGNDEQRPAWTATVQRRFPPRWWPGAEQTALKAREELKLKKVLHEYERLVGSGSSKKPRTSGAVRQATQIPLAPPKSAPPPRVASPPRPGPRPGPGSGSPGPSGPPGGWNRRRFRVPGMGDEVVTAYHEAGHAVVARYSGVKVDELTIIPRSYYLGRVRIAISWAVRLLIMKTFLRSHKRLRNRAETGGLGDYWHRLERDGPAYLLVLLGGAVAEQIKFGKWGRSGCRSDLQKFHLVVQGLVCDRPGPVGDNDIERPDRVAAGSTVAVERTRYWDQVHEILTRPEVWAWVEAVAEAALERGTLTGDEIDALRPTEGGAAGFPMRHLCVRSGCNSRGVALVEMDVKEVSFTIRDLDEVVEPGQVVLCEIHVGRLRAPRGWTLVDARTVGGESHATGGDSADSLASISEFFNLMWWPPSSGKAA